jgi:hypothetical protein
VGGSGILADVCEALIERCFDGGYPAAISLIERPGERMRTPARCCAT